MNKRSGERIARAVTFDLWGTLIRDTRQGSRWARIERIRRINQTLCEGQIIAKEEAIDRAYDVVGERLDALWKTNRDVGITTHLEWLLDVLQPGVSTQVSQSLMERLVDAYTSPIMSVLPVPMEGAFQVLSSLASQRIRMAVICNTGRTPGKVLRRILGCLELGKYLPMQTYSDEVRLRKPHPEIFTLTLAGLGSEPHETVHVGDTLATDFAGAVAIGMRAVHFCHPGGADPVPAEQETIFSLTDILKIVS